MCAEHLRPLFDRESGVGSHHVRQLFCQGTNSFRYCGSCPVGSDDRIAKARRRGAGASSLVITSGDWQSNLRRRPRTPHRFSSTHSKPEQGASVSPTWCRHPQSSVTAPQSFQWTEWGHTTSCQGRQCSADSNMEEGDRLLPFVRFSDPYTFLWDDEVGDTHRSGKEREENKEMR